MTDKKLLCNKYISTDEALVCLAFDYTLWNVLQTNMERKLNLKYAREQKYFDNALSIFCHFK